MGPEVEVGSCDQEVMGACWMPGCKMLKKYKKVSNFQGSKNARK